MFMLKCVKSSKNLTSGKFYECYGLVGSFYYVILDDSKELVSYLPDHFEMRNGKLVTYDENNNEIK